MVGWDEFLQQKQDGMITDTEYPLCGPIFSALPKESLRRLVLRMLHPDPEKRISIHDILSDRWMNRIECCCPDPKDMGKTVNSIDAAGKGSGKLAVQMRVHKVHNHLPPEKREKRRIV